jgi:hypothetical protein
VEKRERVGSVVVLDVNGFEKKVIQKAILNCWRAAAAKEKKRLQCSGDGNLGLESVLRVHMIIFREIILI